MPDLLARLRSVVWTAVGAVTAALLSVVTALGGASIETVAAFGAAGVSLSILSLRQS